jgi:gluconolactonase
MSVRGRFAWGLLAVGCGARDADAPAEASRDAGADVASDAASTVDAPVTDAAVLDGAAGDAAEGDTLAGRDPLAGASAVKRLAGGFGFTEGTAWNAAGFLLFSDIPNDTIHRLVPGAAPTSFKKPSGKSNGLAWTPDGQLVACEHGNRRVSRSAADGSATVTVADAYGGKRLNSPNDAIVRSDGNLYFTDPTYGLDGRPAELAFRGVFRVDPKGALTLVDDGLTQPNGVALSPDEGTLYVGDSGAPKTWAWSVGPDGVPSAKRPFAPEGSDGMAVDDDGNVYLTTASGVAVYKPTGNKWGTLPVPERPTNLSFGAAERTTLFISARTSIYAVVLAVPGKP